MKLRRLSALVGCTVLLSGPRAARAQVTPPPPAAPPRDGRVDLSLEDTDLASLVRRMGELTGRRFIYGPRTGELKATIVSPERVTVAEAYQAFLSVLESNGLTVIPHGRFCKIVETAEGKARAPVFGVGVAPPAEDRYVTRLHRVRSARVEEVGTVLGRFKSKDGDVTVYAPGSLLILTDTSTNVDRLLRIAEELDVPMLDARVFIEPVHYIPSSDLAKRLHEVLGPVLRVVADERTNALIVVASDPGYLRALELIKALDVPPKVGEGDVHVLPLQHADAQELLKTLNEIVGGATPPGGGPPGAGAVAVFESHLRISADKATNSLIVTASRRDLANLRLVLDRLDQPRRQVFIEAAILDLNVDRENQLGVAFHVASATNATGSGNSILYGGLNPFRTIGLPSTTDSSLNALALGIRGPGVSGTENLLGTGVSIPAFGVLLNALASTNDADILSTPHILATDNVPAEISIGQNIPLQTNSGSASISGLGGASGAVGGGSGAPRQDIGTKVKIVPHLNDSDQVRLEVSEEVSDIIGQQPQGSLGAIPFAKRTAQTQLVVADQQTVVIGGLVRSHWARAVTKIPVLGDIPILGALFRSDSSTLQKSNLTLILTPHIVREQEDLRGVFERKMQERQEFLDHYFVFADDAPYEPPKDYGRTTGLLEDIRCSYREAEERRRQESERGADPLRTHVPVAHLPP